MLTSMRAKFAIAYPCSFFSHIHALRPVYSDTTQLNSTSSCRHVHSVNNKLVLC